MKIFFGTVFYKQAYEYLADFIESINSQTYKNFKVLIINDDLEDDEIGTVLSYAQFEYEIIHFTKKYSPSGLRIMLLMEAFIRNADILIIGDADDTFSKNRIECIKNMVEKEDDYIFYYNDICTFSGVRVFPELPKSVNKIEDICDYNFLGMSNTAIRVNMLSLDEINSYFEGDHPIFDWYLFSRLLIDGATGRYVEGAVTYYRYHENNLVGNQDLNKDIIDREIQVKKTHYQSLSNHSVLMDIKKKEYEEGHIQINSTHNPHFWWGYTKSIGGKNL